MKRIIKLFICLIFLLAAISINITQAYAEESSYDEEISSQVDNILEEYGISYSYDDMSGLSLKEMAVSVKETALSKLKAPFRLLGIVLLLLIFTSLMKNTGETVLNANSPSELYTLICVLAAVTVISPQLLEVYSDAASAIEKGGSFMLVFVPIFAGISIISGGITSAGIYNGIILSAAELMVQLASTVIMPILAMMAALAVSGSVFPSNSLDGIIQLVRRFITWSMTLAATIFTGFLSMKCVLGEAVDGFAVKTAKFMISGFIPVVGSAVADAYTTVRGSFDVMRCTAGTAGTAAIILLMLPPVLEVMAFRAVLWISEAAAGMFSVRPLEKLFKNLDCGLAIILSILICFSGLFIISTAILMKTAS